MSGSSLLQRYMSKYPKDKPALSSTYSLVPIIALLLDAGDSGMHSSAREMCYWAYTDRGPRHASKEKAAGDAGG
ncbi:hypothetical protein PG984_001270 [Apiospora sp. TS-2023a]